MKLEIDPTNLPALKRLMHELAVWSDMVALAIQRHEEQSQPQLPIELSMQEGAREAVGVALDGEAKKLVSDLLATLAANFTTTDIVGRAQRANPELSRGAIRNAISDLVEKGVIREIQPGRGRRPAKYVKN